MPAVIRAVSFSIGLLIAVSAHAEIVDLTSAVVVVAAGDRPAAEKIAPTILTEEVARRTDVHWTVTTGWPKDAPAIIAVSTLADPPEWSNQVPSISATVPRSAEAYALTVFPPADGRPLTVVVTGKDARGAMFGVGKLLRNLIFAAGRVSLNAGFSAIESPDRPLRGHQIGYRDTANSWDAWTVDQYDQYFRELAIFGTNAVENIPWQEDKTSPLMKYSRAEMNLKFAELCDKYDLDHWIWVPILIRLPNEAEEETFLREQEEFYRKVKRLDAVFVPGGDPGNNKANVLLPYLERMASLALKYHPNARIWLSLQHFKRDDVDLLYRYLDEKSPKWFGGLVMGPSSPPMEYTRKRLPKSYRLRWYPDITHCVRCQYPVPWMDPALGLTLGREPVNPRPVDYTQIYRMDYRFTDGFLSYSDGVNDDFNKCLWSQLGWNPDTNPRDVAKEYARFFFGSDVAETGADGLFALESNMRGSLEQNASISAAFLLWKEMERLVPDDKSRWRFRMHLFRACYDQYTRARLIYEAKLEKRCLAILGNAKTIGVRTALNDARETLDQASTRPVDRDLQQRLNAFGEELFDSIGLQTSVPKYHASNYERGAVLDFVDYPLNNRWWLEEQFDRISALPDAASQFNRIDLVKNWENPGPEGYYDVVGHVARSPRIMKLMYAGDAMRHENDIPMPTQRWVGEKRNNLRQAWQIYMDDIPKGITYDNLDSSANYTVKLFAQRKSPLVIDGVKARLIRTGETYDQVTEQVFEVPSEALKDGQITLTWEKLDERSLNWRDRHYVTDIWVMKH